MKKIVLIMFSLFSVISCTSSDDKSNYTNDNINEPLPTNRGYNMSLALGIEFVNNDGVNILAPENQMINGNDLDIDIYGVNGYENEFPYPVDYQYNKFMYFYVRTKSDNTDSYMLVLNGYEYKTEAIQQVFGDRGWFKYKITFPDNT